MSFRGAIALTPQSLNPENKWAKYFSNCIDACQFPEEIDCVYQYWADCINSGKYRPMPPPPQSIDVESAYHSAIKRAYSIPAPPHVTSFWI